MPRNTTTTPAASITGRDNYIRNQALLYAIAHIQSLPQEQQEFSNMCDMCSLVLANRDVFTVGQIVGVEAHTGQSIDLWPLDEEDYTTEQLLQKAKLVAAVEWQRNTSLAWLVSKGEAASSDPTVLAMVAKINANEPILFEVAA